MPRPRKLDQPRTVSLRVSAQDYRRLTGLEIDAKRREGGFSKSDVLRGLIRSQSEEDRRSVLLEADLQARERVIRDQRQRILAAERARARSDRQAAKARQRNRKDVALRRALVARIPHVEGLVAKGFQGKTGTIGLDRIWLQECGQDWRRVLGRLRAMEAELAADHEEEEGGVDRGPPAGLVGGGAA